jgi:hypothetical protein
MAADVANHPVRPQPLWDAIEVPGHPDLIAGYPPGNRWLFGKARLGAGQGRLLTTMN